MKLGTLTLGTAGAALLAVGAPVTAPAASAVTPATATVRIDCGDWGTGEGTLTATQDGSAAAIDFTTHVVWSAHTIPAGIVESTLVLTDANGADVTFSGHANPELNLPQNGIDTGPMDGTVAAGDVLQAKSVTISYLGFTSACTVTAPQTPGPFTF